MTLSQVWLYGICPEWEAVRTQWHCRWWLRWTNLHHDGNEYQPDALSVAPSALSTPMVFILLSTMIIRHAMIEKHATKPSVQALRLCWCSASRAMRNGWDCFRVWLIVGIRLTRMSAQMLCVCQAVDDAGSYVVNVVAWFAIHAYIWSGAGVPLVYRLQSFKFPIRICSSKVSKSVLKIPQILHLRILTCWLFINRCIGGRRCGAAVCRRWPSIQVHCFRKCRLSQLSMCCEDMTGHSCRKRL